MLANAAVPLLLSTALTWLDPAALTPPQRGVCVTEWTDGQRLEIPVEVLGVLDATAPDRTAVLIRLDDPRFAGGGVAAGMSGSPVYVNGTLLGALAFGWAFAKEPLAGVTPFATMHRLAGGPATPLGAAPTLAQLSSLVAGKLEPAALLPVRPGSPVVPIPVAVGGFAPPSGFGRQVLESMGLQPVPTGGVSALAGIPAAGDMIAAILVWGDANIAAGGTATAVEGDKVWAFGHQFLALGGVRLPAARARVIAVQNSYQNSFKIFTVGQPFGTFVADRTAGMLAVAGSPPAGIPVDVTVHEPLGDSGWHFRIAEVPLLEPLLVTYLTNACLTARGAASGEATVRVRLSLSFADGRQVAVEQTVRSLDALARAAAFTGATVGLLEASPFAKPALTAVTVDLCRLEQAESATVTEVLPDRTTLRPGETLDIRVRLAPYREAERTVPLRITVPPDTRPGRLDLIVADGAAWTEYRLKAAGEEPVDFTGQLAQLAGFEPNATLVAALESKEPGVAVPGGSQPRLPPSWAATLAIGLGDGAVTRLSRAFVATTRWTAPYPLEGAFRIALTIRPPLAETP
ncbi:MAG: hypothetical protein ACM3O7_01535 [Acidobacteriota bacterium]